MTKNILSIYDMGNERTRTNMVFLFKKYGVPNNMIEIGCFEGLTTFWVSDLCGAVNDVFKLYAIDPHTILNNNKYFDFESIKKTFQYNLNDSTGNVEYINKYSYEGLIDLINRKVEAEFIFIDGDHSSAAVLEDMILSWRLLVVGGIMLCDDSIGWKLSDEKDNYPVQMSPRMGIESFIQTHWHKLEVISVPNSMQTALVKLQD